MSIGNGTGAGILAQAFNEFGGLVSIRIADSSAMDGIAFSLRKRFTLAPEGVLDIVLDAEAFTGQKLIFGELSFDAKGGPLLVDVYGGITDDGDGAILPMYNRDFTSSNIPQVVVRKDPAGVVPSGLPIEFLVPSNGVPAVSASAGAGGDTAIAVLAAVKYLLRITNTDSTDAVFGVKLDFFEVPFD